MDQYREILKSLLMDFPSCPCCFQDYNVTTRAPIILGCAHTLCRECIGSLFNQNSERKVICPTCRTHNYTGCNRGDCPGFLKNFELGSTVEKLMKAKEKVETLEAKKEAYMKYMALSDFPQPTPNVKPIGSERQLSISREGSPPETQTNKNEKPVATQTKPNELFQKLLNWAVTDTENPI